MGKKITKGSMTSFFWGWFFLNVVWLLGLVIASFIYGYFLSRIKIVDDFMNDIPWYFALLMLFIPFITIQGILHWLMLKHFFPQKNIGNIIWVLIMPLLFTACFAYVHAYLFAQTVEHLK